MDWAGVTVRNFWRTYKLSWPEVSHLGDGSVYMGDAGYIWALGVVLRDGRVRSVSTAVGLGFAEIEEIRQAAARFAVPAMFAAPTESRMRHERPAEGLYEDPGGLVGLRYWDGSTWSPLLPSSAGKGWFVWKTTRPERRCQLPRSPGFTQGSGPRRLMPRAQRSGYVYVRFRQRWCELPD
jgi:hypothetical protein